MRTDGNFGGRFKLADRSYAEALRAIGKDISMFQPNYLEIRHVEGRFYVRGKQIIGKPGVNSATHRRTLKSRISKLVTKKNHRISSRAMVKAFEREYTPEDIRRLSRDLKITRESRNLVVNERRLTDTYSLSELFRAIGAILDEEGAHLQKLSKEHQTYVVQTEERDGTLATREYTTLSLQKIQRKMFWGRRKVDLLDPWAKAQ